MQFCDQMLKKTGSTLFLDLISDLKILKLRLDIIEQPKKVDISKVAMEIA